MLTLVLLYNIFYFRTSPFRHGSNNTHNFCGNYSARNYLFQPCMHHFKLLFYYRPLRLLHLRPQTRQSYQLTKAERTAPETLLSFIPTMTATVR